MKKSRLDVNESQLTAFHVAIVGFSVSADPNGYVKHLAHLAESEGGYSIEFVAVGGLHPRDMCFLIDRINFSKKPDLILFEVLTSSARSNSNPHSYIRNCLCQLVSAAAGRGANSALLNLYRDDVDYETDVFLSVARNVSHEHQLPLIDLAPDAIGVIGEIGRENALADVVHPKGNLAKTYAKRAHEEILKIITMSFSSCIGCQPRGSIIHIDMQTQEPYLFKRSGLIIQCSEIPEGGHARVDIPPMAKLVGIACLMGPLSCRLALCLDDKIALEVLPYDDRSYYERLGFFYFGFHTCRQVQITQLPGIPDVPLFKGEINSSPRMGRIYGLLVE